MPNCKDTEMYMEYARQAASRSYASRLKVGAVLVNRDIIAMGYNGTPRGWDNCCEDDCGNTKPEVIHAEKNAIFKFVQSGISTVGGTLYQTHSPCGPCAQDIALSGIVRVVYENEYRCRDGIDFLVKSGIVVEKYQHD